MAYMWFSLVTIFSTLPLSPLLSKVGLSVCPIMRSHGFLFGCQINFQFVASLCLLSLVVGNFLIFYFKRIKKPIFFKIETSVWINIVYILLLSAGTLTIKDSIFLQIAHAGSPYGAMISAILLASGFAALFLQVVVLDLFLIETTDEKFAPTEETLDGLKTLSLNTTAKLSELWDFALLVAAPLLVLGFFFYFSISLLDAQVEGWGTLADQKPRLLKSGLLFFIWYSVYFTGLFLKRLNLIRRLTKQATSLKNLKSGQRLSLNRMALMSPVAQALNNSAEVLSDRNRLISGFSKFVSDRLIEQVVSADDFELKGQQTKAAILMTDLRDFTTISQSMAADQVVKMLNIYFDDMIRVLHKHSIVVDKFIGDGLLAYVTKDVDDLTACSNAVIASLEMIEQMKTTNEKLRSQKLPELRLGIGIHYGDVVLGSMGSASRMQYTIIGDAVNRAARIESLTKDLKCDIAVSTDVYTRLPADLQQKFSGPTVQSIKGIDTPIEIFTIERQPPLTLPALKSSKPE